MNPYKYLLLATLSSGLALPSVCHGIPFLTTDGTKLFWGDTSGPAFGPGTLSAGIQSLTIMPSDVQITGAKTGDIIAMATSSTSSRWNMYVLEDPYGTPALTKVLSVNHNIGSLVFANGKMYGIDASLNPSRIYEIDPVTGNSTTTYNTGVAMSGGGGLAYNSLTGLFYFTDGTNHRLYSWAPGGSATNIGGVGFAFSNNGLEFVEGELWGALRPDAAPTTLRVGKFDLGTGAFTTTTTVSGVNGGGTGFVVVPEPATLALSGLGMVALLRRRKAR